MATTIEIPDSVADAFTPELAAKLVGLRKDLHRHPELSFEEYRTAEKLYEELEALAPASLERVAKTGVIARIKGREPGGPVVALRGDIDALPITEATGFEWSSENEGVMHACGHDVHATWTIGAAHLLSERPARGDVLILLQPAEEIARGAPAVIESGVLDCVDAIFGAHVDRRFALGEVVAQEGTVGASTDVFDITLKGVGAHGARPDEARDPIVGLGALIGAMQTIVSRRLHPSVPAVVTIGKVGSGTAPNIIPDEAHLTGTMRAADPTTRQLLTREVQSIAEAIAHGYGLDADVKFKNGTPAVINPEEATSWAYEAASGLVGKESMSRLKLTNMGGEDFAYYLEKMPGCFLRIGAREEGADEIPAHSPYFYATEGAIFVGAAVLAETARVASEKLAAG